jgi:peptide/nickel transport system ATP-binding protein
MILPLLQINNVSIDFLSDGNITNAVQNISLEVNRGEIVAIVGESGSGKSVTALSILQLLPSAYTNYKTGEILFSPDNKNTLNILKQTEEEMQKIRGNQIAMIFQEPMSSLNPVFTCGNQLVETIRQHKKITTKEAWLLTLALFEKMKLPDPSGIFKRCPHQLSGGQKQRVMIAMAMSCNPSLLICDEPTTALDVIVQKTILGLVRKLQQSENMGVIFITHDLGVVEEIADRVIVLYKGKMVETGTVKDLFANPKHPYTKGLLYCRPGLHPRGERLPVIGDFLDENKEGSGVIRTGQSGCGNVEWKEKPLPGVNEKVEIDKRLVRVEQLCVWYPSKKSFFGKPILYTKAVDNVSFDIYQGETLGLVGESGCGKTTLGRSLLRLIRPSSGKVLFKDKDLGTIPSMELKLLRKHIQIIFQDPYSALNPRIIIGSAIEEALKVHQILPTRKERKERVMDLLEKVNLKPEFYNRYPHEFSGGQRQRIVIARALALNPSFIVCDESVSALDVSVQAQVLNLLNDLKKEFGFTVVFISHDLSVVRYISDRILVMYKGKIEESGDSDEVYYHPKKEYTRELIASIPKGG